MAMATSTRRRSLSSAREAASLATSPASWSTEADSLSIAAPTSAAGSAARIAVVPRKRLVASVAGRVSGSCRMAHLLRTTVRPVHSPWFRFGTFPLRGFGRRSARWRRRFLLREVTDEAANLAALHLEHVAEDQVHRR